MSKCGFLKRNPQNMKNMEKENWKKKFKKLPLNLFAFEEGQIKIFITELLDETRRKYISLCSADIFEGQKIARRYIIKEIKKDLPKEEKTINYNGRDYLGEYKQGFNTCLQKIKELLELYEKNEE